MTKNRVFYLIIAFVSLSVLSFAQDRDIYQLKVYSIDTEVQEQRMDEYLKDAYIPAMHRAGVEHVGVFKPIESEENAGKLIYVLTPFAGLAELVEMSNTLSKDEEYKVRGSEYINASHDDPPYQRIESTIMRAFSSFPKYGVPSHSTDASQQIYELRSYQGATEKYYEKKVEMFDMGEESKLFVDLGFQPIFFGEVISGSIMPNLMYLTTFESKESQDERWAIFRDSPKWLELKSDPQYANTVSKIDKYLLHPTEYSDL